MTIQNPTDLSLVLSAVNDVQQANMLCILDLALLLHDAGILDKSKISERWAQTAKRTDLPISNGVRTLIEVGVRGLNFSEAEAKK